MVSVKSMAIPSVAEIKERARLLFPGIMVAVIVAMTAKFLSEHYATPAMLLALLSGNRGQFSGRRGQGGRWHFLFGAHLVAAGRGAVGCSRVDDPDAGSGLESDCAGGWRGACHDCFWVGGGPAVWPQMALCLSDGRVGGDLRCLGGDGNLCHSAQRRTLGRAADLYGAGCDCSVHDCDDCLSGSGAPAGHERCRGRGVPRWHDP